MVTLPAVEGQIGVLPLHTAPLLTQVIPGEMIVRKNGHETFVAIGEGLVVVTGDRVAIVTDMAVAADKHRRSESGGSAPARRGPPARQALRRRSRVGERLASPIARSVARQTPPA